MNAVAPTLLDCLKPYGILPIVQIDTREKERHGEAGMLTFTQLPTRRASMPVGDYGLWRFSDYRDVADDVCVHVPELYFERKSLEDLVSSCIRGHDRFRREMARGRVFARRYLIVEGLWEQIRDGAYRSAASPNSVLATLAAISAEDGVEVIWCGDREQMARHIEDRIAYFARGIAKRYAALKAPKEPRPLRKETTK